MKPKSITLDLKAAEASDQAHITYLLGGLFALFVAFQVYNPALHGPFVFDDLFLTYSQPHAASTSLSEWCGLRPVLGLSFWATFQSVGQETFSYHVFNLLLHYFSAVLVFLMCFFTGLRKRLAGRRRVVFCRYFCWPPVPRNMPSVSSWYQYVFTETRAFFGYFRLFYLPFGQNVDHDFPVSHSAFEHGAILALVGAALLLFAAYAVRKRFPLAAYGLFAFVVLLAPTSSIIPISDVFVERRLYIAFIGPVFISLEILRRFAIKPKLLAVGLGVVCAFFGYLAWQRAHVWARAEALWADSAAKSPRKVRPRVGVANAYLHLGKCADAIRE